MSILYRAEKKKTHIQEYSKYMTYLHGVYNQTSQAHDFRNQNDSNKHGAKPPALHLLSRS